MVLGQGSLFVNTVHPCVEVDQNRGNDDHHHNQDEQHHLDLVLLADQNLRECDSYVEGVGSFGIAKLEAVLLGFVVSQTLISLGDHNEHGSGLGVVGIPVRVVVQCQSPVGLLDFGNGGTFTDMQNLVRVEPLHLLFGTAHRLIRFQDKESQYKCQYEFEEVAAGQELEPVFCFVLGDLVPEQGL